MRNVLVAMTVAATMGAVAQNTFVFDPAEGETLTVATRLTGATNVVANSGASGGGIVQLLARYSDYTGVTSNNCGTLWPSFIGPGSEYGSLGGTGMICLGKGTLKYTGQAGAINAPVVHTGGTNDYTVYDIGEGSDLSLTGPVTLDTRLVKRGTGTLRFAREGTSSFFLQGGTAATPNHINGCYRINFNDNGDAPTQGGSGITVAEGTVSFDKGTYTLGSSGYPLCIGAYTAADNEQETSGIVDIRGASVTISSDVNLGVFNGFTSTTPDYRPSSAFRIYSGTITLPSSVWFGRCYYDPTAGKVMNSNPRFEMHGGTASRSQIVTFQMGNLPGLLSEFTVDGGSLAVNYFVPSLNLFPGIATGSYKGDATSTNLITIGGTGVVDFSRIQNNSGEITYVRLNDEGVFKTCFLNNSSGWMALDFNGGTLLQNYSSDFALISNNMSRVTVGAKGGVIGATGSFVAHVQKGIVPFPGLEGTDGGVTISNAAATGVVRLYGVNTYAGPTTVKTGAIELVGDGLLSPNSRLVLTGGKIVVTNRQQTVAGFTLGQTASGTTEEFRFTKTMPLIVTADIKLKGSPELTIVPLESDGSVSTTVGDYTVMIAPIAQKQMLEAMTVRCKAPNLSSEFFNVVEDGDNVKLVIQTTDPGLDPVDPNYGYWTNPAGGEWMTATNWEDTKIAESYDMHALFSTAAQAGGATVSVPTAGVELESLEATAGSYTFNSGSLKPMRIDLHANADFKFSGGAHEISGNVYVGGGTANAMPKLAVSGGSLTCDNLYLAYDSTKTQTESPTVEISGGVVTAKTSVVVSYHGGSGTNRFTMTGGKLVTPSVEVCKISGSQNREDVLSFSNCEIDLGTGTFNGNVSTSPRTITFGESSVIRAGLVKQSATAESGYVLCFDGGTFKPTAATSDSATSGILASYLFTGKIGSNGMTIDTSEVAFREGEIDNYVPIHFVLQGNGNKVYATGGGCVYFNGYNHSFHNATIIATNETTIVVQGYATQASPVTIVPGSALRFTKAVQTYSKALTFGTAGATTPTKLEFNHANGFAMTTNQFVATKLVVNSKVSVAWCTNGWKSAAICPNGTYTGLVYTVAGSTVAASDFVLPAKYEGYKTLTTELLDYSGTQKAVVFTIAGTEPPEPEPPAPVPETFDTLTVRTGEQAAVSDGDTVKNLTVEGGAWATPSVTGSFTVSDMLQLGEDGTIASAALNGDFTIGSNCVWRIDFDNALLNYDLLVVDGNLTIQPGVTIDFGRVIPNRVPQKYSLPIAKYTGICSAPASVKVINAGAVLNPAKLYLTTSAGVLYASPVPGAMVITIR